MRLLFSFVLLLFNLFPQAQKHKAINATYNGNLYEFRVGEPADDHSILTLCDSLKTCHATASLVWPIDEATFTSQLKTLLLKFDQVDSKESNLELGTLTQQLFAWVQNQWKGATEQEKQMQTTLDAVKEVMKKESGKTKIGVLELLEGKTVDVYEGKAVKRKETVEEVRMSIENGVIGRRALFVLLSDGSIFFNENAPINFPTYFRRRSDNLTPWNGNEGQTIKLGEVMNYKPFGKIFYPADAEIRLVPKEKAFDTLDVSSDLNNMIDISIYTDLLGVLGDKPNGLIQTEIAGNFISNTGNMPNTNLTFHHFMRPYIRLSRFDSKFRSLDSNNVIRKEHGDSVNRTYLNQISYLQGGLKFNVVKVGMGINQVLSLNGGADINLVNADSIYQGDLTFFNYYGELYYTITKLRNFGMDASLRLNWQRLSDGSQMFNILNRGTVAIFTPQVSLFYFPTDDTSSRLYFRFSYFDNIKDSRYNFSQFQIGYKTSLKLKD